MQALERDYAKMQQDEQLKWQRAIEDHRRKERELEEKAKQEKAQVQALKIMQDIFEAKIEERQRDCEKRDADREAEVKRERDLNQQQIAALEARITQYENDLTSRKNRPAVISWLSQPWDQDQIRQFRNYLSVSDLHPQYFDSISKAQGILGVRIRTKRKLKTTAQGSQWWNGATSAAGVKEL
ncbi:hypothetical protein CEP54_003729 [Fusarium duplospermum]|uniref:Uncharacterized protein n=1 Tax=Fusarium duplospermum TaxID=1325734 RepID=A0A428QMJ2_9HYPO|nr:hypothetical protein CEP54_003729 [Fusarium duplospermum]